jgi:hypothetical protein
MAGRQLQPTFSYVRSSHLSQQEQFSELQPPSQLAAISFELWLISKPSPALLCMPLIESLVPAPVDEFP